MKAQAIGVDGGETRSDATAGSELRSSYQTYQDRHLFHDSIARQAHLAARIHSRTRRWLRCEPGWNGARTAGFGDGMEWFDAATGIAFVSSYQTHQERHGSRAEACGDSGSGSGREGGRGGSVGGGGGGGGAGGGLDGGVAGRRRHNLTS